MGDAVIPIHVLDFNNNSYFYNKLSLLTGGNFVQYYQGISNQQNVDRVFNLRSIAIPGRADIHTELENGLISLPYTRSNSTDLIDLEKPILQVGRIHGSGAFRINAQIEQNGVLESQEILLTEDLSIHSDSMVREMWAGNHLAFLEAEASDYIAPLHNASIWEAIAFSIAERVLGDYTAFVCLEPGLGGEICETCVDETDPTTDTDDPERLAGLSWNAFPNPFTDQLTVKLTLPENTAIEDCSMTLFDATGRVVRQFGRQDMSGAGRDWQLVWDGRSENGMAVPSGLYVLVLSTPQGKYHLKVMCVR